MKKKILKNIDWGIFICCILLSIIGMVALFSATYDSEDTSLQRQIIWFVICIPIVFIIIFIDYEAIAKISPIFYGIVLILLVIVLFTDPVNGATSWFDLGFLSIQPAEFAKIAVILFLALVLCKIQEKGKDEINRPTKLLLALAVVAIPVLLIIKQPDYGTAAAFLVATVMILFTAGINKKYIIGTILLVIIAVPLLYFFVLPEHAKERIEVFLNPESDPRGSGYNLTQSKLAIGAGQLTGMGLLKGNQTQLGFLYPKTTDFIFSVIGEEMRDVESLNLLRQAAESGRMDWAWRGVRSKGRDNAHTPMQWDASPNGGFTGGAPWIMVNPNVQEINVAAALRDPDSVLHYYRALLALRREQDVLRYGDFSLLLHEHPQVFAYARTFEGQQIRIYCNFTDRDAPLPEAFCKEKVLLTNVNYEKTDVLLPYEAAVVMA